MKHLTIDEIIEFVTFTELNEDTVMLASRVNGHISECSQCLELVRAFQLINDELYEGFGKEAELEELYEKATNEFLKKEGK